jgi:hypothetical protein
MSDWSFRAVVFVERFHQINFEFEEEPPKLTEDEQMFLSMILGDI